MLPAHNHNMPVRSIDADDNLSATAVAGSPNGTEMASPLKVRKCRSRGEPRLAVDPNKSYTMEMVDRKELMTKNTPVGLALTNRPVL